MAPTKTLEEQFYSRHYLLPELGRAGQKKLKNSKVLIVGMGALGCSSSTYLAAAGVGELTLIDADVVTLSNLTRQPLYTMDDLGRLKVAVGSKRLRAINPFIKVEHIEGQLNNSNALQLFKSHDIIIDGSDNFPTKYLINDGAVLTGKPFVFGSVHRFEGQVALLNIAGGPTYRCLFPEPPEDALNCSEAGVLGVLPGIIGAYQGALAIKYLAQLGTNNSQLTIVNILAGTTTTLSISRSPQTEEISGLQSYDGYNSCPMSMSNTLKEMTVSELSSALKRGDKITIIDVREEKEFSLCNLAQFGAKLIPIAKIAEDPSGITACLPQNHTIVLHCHHGGRSARAAKLLMECGATNVVNLAGGIHAWACQIDTKMAQY